MRLPRCFCVSSMRKGASDAYHAGRVRLEGSLRLALESQEFVPHGSDDHCWCWLSPEVEHEILERHGQPAEVLFDWLNFEKQVEVEGELSLDG
jgi:hypothetical protein